jgi:glutathione synthase/RimK-type ligase-like ATP-grasp enzyme
VDKVFQVGAVGAQAQSLMPMPITTPNIAFVTYRTRPEITTDDALAAAQLEIHGAKVFPAVWDDPSIEWSNFHAVILRSCWDYHLRTEEFHTWLKRLTESGANVFNRPSIAEWNLDKRYLQQLADRGARIVPTIWTSENSDSSLEDAMNQFETDQVVIKPVISATAHDTWVARRADLPKSILRLSDQRRRAPVMIQPFIESITTIGEWSMIYFDGHFSHGVLKRTAPGDFRVQEEWGGVAESKIAPDDVRQESDRAMACLDEPPLYARVDLVEAPDGPSIMELELIESAIYLGLGQGAPVTFAEAILARL